MTSNTPAAPTRKSSTQSRHRWRFGIAVAAATAAAATAAALGAPAAATPQAKAAPTVSAAGTCIHQVFGLIPSSTPWQDMALGFVNGSTNNAPVGLRDSKALSRAELWIELDGPGNSVYLQNVNTDAGTFAVTRGDFGDPTIVTKHLNSNDDRQRWEKELNGSWVRYKAPNGKYISYSPGNSAKPFQLTTGNGDTHFKPVVGGCYEF